MLGQEFIDQIQEAKTNPEALKVFPELEYTSIITDLQFKNKVKVMIDLPEADAYGIVRKFFFININHNDEYDYGTPLIVYFLTEDNLNSGIHQQARVFIEKTHEDSSLLFDIYSVMI